eukprot:gene7637-5491_t
MEVVSTITPRSTSAVPSLDFSESPKPVSVSMDSIPLMDLMAASRCGAVVNQSSTMWAVWIPMAQNHRLNSADQVEQKYGHNLYPNGHRAYSRS